MNKTAIKKRYVLIYPWKFVNSLYTIMGLDGFSEETEVIVLDISILFNKKFSEVIAAASTLIHIRKIKSLRQLIVEIWEIKKQACNKKTCVNNMVPINSLKALVINLLCFYYFKNTEIKVLTFTNFGTPDFKDSNRSSSLFSSVSGLSSIEIIIKKIISYAWGKIPSPMRCLLTHKLVAGKYYMERELKSNVNKSIIILRGHSYDYDRYLSSKSNKTVRKEKNTIVFLDEPGPLFRGDYILAGDKKYKKTVEVWYPSLCRFFDKLETVFNAKVVIAAHYKTAFTSPSPIFGGREVFYGNTNELVKRSILMVTEASSAVSFAVIYRLPIYFVYSDESKNDIRFIQFVEELSRILGQPVYNINRLDALPETLPRVDENKYQSYEDQFLTSDHDGRTNAQLIEQDVML